MPWVRLDDRFPSHRKVALLSDRAFRLHVSAICWCAENLTDGRIQERELPLVARLRSPKATAKQLEDAGLWDRADDGWMIHDYLNYNPSRDQVLAERKKNAERQERFRRRRTGKPTPPDEESHAGSNGVTQKTEMQDGDTNSTGSRHEVVTNSLSNRPVDQAEPQVSEVRNGVTNKVPTRPDPNPIDVVDVGGGSTGSWSRTTEPAAAGPAAIDADGFAVTDGMRRWAHRDGYAALVDIDHATAQFVSHYRSTGARRQSWPDAWQKWIRDDAKRAAERHQRPGNVIQLPNGQALTGTDAKVAGWLSLPSDSEQEIS